MFLKCLIFLLDVCKKMRDLVVSIKLLGHLQMYVIFLNLHVIKSF